MGRGRPKKQPVTEQPNELREIPAVSISEAAEPLPPSEPDTLELTPSTDAVAEQQPESKPSPQDENKHMSETKTSGDTVVVGCKLPCGLVISHDGKSVELKGSRESNIINGFGLTPGVDAEFFEAWKKVHKNMPYVKNELIFAYSDERSAQDMADERIKEKTGLEGLNPDKPGKDLERVPEEEEDD